MATGDRGPRPMTIFDGFALILIAFKLAGVGEPATWSWWQVLTPIWLYLLAVLAVKLILRAAKKKEAKQARKKAFQ